MTERERRGVRTYLCVSRVGIEDIREELARARNACHNQSMDIEAVDHEIEKHLPLLVIPIPILHSCHALRFRNMILILWRGRFRHPHRRIRTHSLARISRGSPGVHARPVVFVEGGEAALIDHCSHAVEVDEEAEEDFVCRRAIFVDAHEVAGNGDGGDILAMESEHARGLGGEIVLRGDLSVYAGVLLVILACDFGQEAGYHLDDILHRHGADFVLLAF